MNIEKYKKIGIFTLSSGKKSNTYYDLKEAMGEPENLMEIVERIDIENDLSGIDVIIGIDYGGVPLAIALSIQTNIPYAILRKRIKHHGMEKLIEGYSKVGKAILLDDVKSTGGTMRKAKEELEEMGYEIVKTYTILDRNEP